MIIFTIYDNLLIFLYIFISFLCKLLNFFSNRPLQTPSLPRAASTPKRAVFGQNAPSSSIWHYWKRPKQASPGPPETSPRPRIDAQPQAAVSFWLALLCSCFCHITTNLLISLSPLLPPFPPSLPFFHRLPSCPPCPTPCYPPSHSPF